MIYLEPRRIFDPAIIQTDPVVYDFEKLIECLMNSYQFEYNEAVDYYCFHIESLKYKGLKIQGE